LYGKLQITQTDLERTSFEKTCSINDSKKLLDQIINLKAEIAGLKRNQAITLGEKKSEYNVLKGENSALEVNNDLLMS
jgi:ribonuclease HIII